MAKTKWQNIPWLAILGILTLVSMVLYTTQRADFVTRIIPTYVLEGALFITVGFSLWKGYTKQGFITFLLGAVWLMNQVLWWSIGQFQILDTFLWLLFLAGIGLFYMFLNKQTIRIGNPATRTRYGKVWSYATLMIIFFFALGKIMVIWAYHSYGHMLGWGIAVLLTTFGYLMPKKEGSGYLKLLGVLIGAYTALTIGGAGLTLLG